MTTAPPTPDLSIESQVFAVLTTISHWNVEPDAVTITKGQGLALTLTDPTPEQIDGLTVAYGLEPGEPATDETARWAGSTYDGIPVTVVSLPR